MLPKPDSETIAPERYYCRKKLAVPSVVTVVGGITAFARFFDAFMDGRGKPVRASQVGRQSPHAVPEVAALPLALVCVLVFWSPIRNQLESTVCSCSSR